MRSWIRVLAAAAMVSLPAADASAAAIAPPGKIEVSRRVDPSLDSFMRTPQRQTASGEMTFGQQWLTTHARPLVVHDSDPTVSLNLTGWATKPKITVYYNATGVNPHRPAQVRGARKWLLKVRGKQVMVDGWMAIDLRKSAARKWWLYGSDGKATCHPDRDQRAALDLLACGYSGLWLDNALTTVHQGFTPKPKISNKAWSRGVLTLLKTLRAKKPAGATVTINMHWTDTSFGYAKRPKLTSKMPAIRAAKLVDQVIIEGGAIDPGLFYAQPEWHPWSYRRLLKFGDAMHRQKVALQWEKTGSHDLTLKGPRKAIGKLPSCRDGDLGGAAPWLAGGVYWRAHVRSAAFNYATALLAYRDGDSVGDMCEYPGRSWRGYERDLGLPAGKRYETSAGLIVRELTAGVIAVNPSDKPVAFSLPGGRTGIDHGQLTWPLSETPVTAVTIAPRSAAVVEYR